MNEEDRAAKIEVQGDNFGIIVSGNNNIISQGGAPVRFTKMQAGAEVPETIGPAALLNPLYQVVPFADFPEWEALNRWLGASYERSAYLICAPGGYGKTRAAVELCQRAQADGWQVLVAVNSADLALGSVLENYKESHDLGALVFMDYADRWPRADFLQLIRSLYSRTGKVRLLIASRSESFWPPTEHLLRASGFQTNKTRLVGPAENLDRSRDIYIASLHAFGSRFGVEVPEYISPADVVSGLPPRHVLGIQVRALLDILAVAEAQDAPSALTWPELSRELIGRELNHWSRMASDASLGIRSSLEDLFRCCMIATLMRGASFQDGHDILEELGFISVDQLMADHAKIYPPADRNTVLWPLLPDRIGEDLIAGSLTTAPEECYLAGWGGPASDHLLRRLLASTVDYRAHDGSTSLAYANFMIRPALVVLSEAGDRWPHVRDLLVRSLAKRPQLAVVAGGSVVAKLAEYLPFEALEPTGREMARFNVNGTNLDLYDGIVKVLGRLHSDPRFSSMSVEDRISILADLGASLAGVGRSANSAEVFGEAVDIIIEHQVRREGHTVKVQPRADKASIGTIISTFADQLSSLNDKTASSFWSSIAMLIFQQWLDEGGDENDSRYLAAAGSYATALADSGKLEESIDLQRKLFSILARNLDTAGDQQKYNLSAVALNLGVRLGESGRNSEGIEYLRHAARIRLNLMESAPWLFVPAFAEAIHDLAHAELEEGDLEAALGFANEAVEIRRRISDNIPGAFEQHLLRSLSILATIRAKVDDTEGALHATEESVSRTLIATTQSGSERDIALQSAISRYILSARAAGRGDDTVPFLGQLLSHAQEPVQLSDNITAWIVLLMGRAFIEHDQVNDAVELVTRQGAAIDTCDVEFIEPYSVFALALEFARAEQVFEVIARPMHALLRLLASDWREDSRDALKDKKHIFNNEILETVGRLVFLWITSAENPDQYSIAVKAALDGAPFLSAKSSLQTTARENLAAASHNAATYAGTLGWWNESALLARISVDLHEQLTTEESDAGTNDNDSGRIAALNTLAIALAFDSSTDSPAGREQAVAIAEKAVQLADKRARSVRTLTAVADVAMCLETYAMALKDSDENEKAMAASMNALSIRLESTLAGRARMLPALVHGWRLHTGIAKNIGNEGKIPETLAALEHALPEDLLIEFRRLKERSADSKFSI